MLGSPIDFWGKLQKADDGTVTAWHPLVDHCCDVAAVCSALLELPTWQLRLARLAGEVELDEVTRARLSVLAAFHDLGKFNLGFQAKGRPELGTTAGHVKEALAVLFRSELQTTLQTLGQWGDACAELLIASICHHGGPQTLDSASASFQRTWWTPRGGLDPSGGVDRLLGCCRRWFPAAFASDQQSTLPKAAQFGHVFAGLVMLADWIGSDTRYFPYAASLGEDRMPFARAASKQLLTEMHLVVTDAQRRDRTDRTPFARINTHGYDARPAQRAVLELPDTQVGSIAVLEAETGSGKTEAALAHFVRKYDRGQVDGLYFALPTRTAATQLFGRVRAAVSTAFEHPPPVVLAVPGYLQVDDATGQRVLPGFDVLWPDQDRFRFRAWAAEHPKRYLAGAIVVGTIDQVLLSALMVGHAHLRATALLRQLLIVDEVHASDAYMTRITEEVLARHVAAGGHALLLSATLGGESRARLLEPLARVEMPTQEAAERTPYPLVTQRDHGGERSARDARGATRQRSIQVQARRWMESPDAIAQAAVEAAQRGAKVLVIRNTVAECVATQIAIENVAADEGLLFACRGVVAPHHARFARRDREALDRALEERIGKVRRDGGCVVVATQTVQQSLDIDADLLLTDLCPADVLLQRLGRLHRHDREDRPSGFEEPRAVVLVPEFDDLGEILNESGIARHYFGLGSVYSDLRILEATRQLVERHPSWRIPEMNRMLVERSVHSEALAGIVEGRGERWKRHAMQTDGVIRAHGRVADLSIVDWAKPYAQTSFSRDLDRRISTRLGEDDRLVSFEPPFAGPFGSTISQLKLRSSWAASAAEDETHGTDVVTSDGQTDFRFANRYFLYDRFGLRPCPGGDAR